MDLVDLDLVVAIAEAGSITGGAGRAHLSLPSASARIRDLERVLGVRLFDRHRRGVTPTDVGALLIRHARTLHRDVKRLHHELAEHAAGYGATVRVHANTAASTGRLGAITAAYLAQHGEVRIDLEHHPGHRIVTAVAEHRADLGIVSDSVDLGGLVTRTLCPDPLVVITAPDDPLARQQTVSYARLDGRPVVGLSTSARFPLDTRPILRARLPTVDAVCQAVAHGVAVAILPRASVADRPDCRIAVLDLEDRWAQRNLVVCSTAGGTLTAAAQQFCEYILEEYRQPDHDDPREDVAPRV